MPRKSARLQWCAVCGLSRCMFLCVSLRGPLLLRPVLLCDTLRFSRPLVCGSAACRWSILFILFVILYHAVYTARTHYLSYSGLLVCLLRLCACSCSDPSLPLPRALGSCIPVRVIYLSCRALSMLVYAFTLFKKVSYKTHTTQQSSTA